MNTPLKCGTPPLNQVGDPENYETHLQGNPSQQEVYNHLADEFAVEQIDELEVAIVDMVQSWDRVHDLLNERFPTELGQTWGVQSPHYPRDLATWTVWVWQKDPTEVIHSSGACPFDVKGIQDAIGEIANMIAGEQTYDEPLL